MEEILKMDENKLAETLAESIIEPLKNYRIAKSESTIESPLFKTETEEEEEENEYKERMKSLHHGDYVKITREEFWIEIIKSKIQTIADIGGIELMRKVCDLLYNNPLNDEYMLYSAFDYYADGIGHWCR